MTAPATLAERRAALKRLLAAGESAIDAYERVLEGASEKDRRSLFKSVPFASLVPPAVEWEWDAVPEDTVRMCVFLRAALAGSEDAGDDYAARWSGRRGGDPREGPDLEALLAAHRRGAAGRSGEWLEEAAGSPGGVVFWHTYRTILAERGAFLTSAPSLEYFARRIIPAPHPTSDETQRFFEENPTFLDHEFWQFFRVEGALPGSALFVWMYREDPSAPGGDFERLHSHDLVRYMATRLPQLRPRILSECLAAQRRDFSAYNARVFSRAWEALEPTREETLEAVADLIALLGAQPSPSVSLAQKSLLGIARELTVEQVDALVQASAQVLARSEKKLLRAHLRLLAALVKAHPGCASAVSDVVAEAEFPLDLQDRAAALVGAPPGSGNSDSSGDCGDEAGVGPAGTAAPGATAQGNETGEGAQASWTFPDAPAADLPRISHTAELPADNDAVVAALHALFEDAAAGAALPALLTRISGDGLELAEADKALLAKYWRSAPNWKGANQLSYLASRLLRGMDVKDAPEAGHFRGYRRKGSEWEQHRGPVRLLHEQLRVALGDKPYDKPNGQDAYRFDPILTEPLEPMDVQWERQIIRAPYQKPVRVVHGDYDKTDDMHETWVIPGQTLATGEDSLAGALANVAGVAPEFTGRLLESGDYRSSGVAYAWAAWALQHNPDILAAHAMPVLQGAFVKFPQVIAPFEVIVRALGEGWRAPGAPTYSALAWASTAAQAPYRAITAEAIASLADTGRYDPAAMAGEFGYLLRNGWFGPGRVAQTLTDCASISALAGYRVAQTIAALLPSLVGIRGSNRMVEALVALAGDYGMRVCVPDELRPKMKGSSALAQALRALDALPDAPTGLAREAAEALGAVRAQRG
ncbi:DUF6493 family protein [uncultured Actinomyces sp.]|uniref:DUF6493 family protein n=1 Tax=uncultured Actinomyces sp. TaxID=249061 RepID=UPI0028E1CFB8|nr:DUF6493 family protein [uncultured Actinomyces sp.]